MITARGWVPGHPSRARACAREEVVGVRAGGRSTQRPDRLHVPEAVISETRKHYGCGRMSCVETFKRTPLQLFNLPQHFVIPLFQRPYVWKEDEQWEPLWKDIRRVAELRIDEPHLDPQHFLGAVVLQAHDPGSNRLTTWNVIDGQQRLTTLQLLMDATSAVLTQAGFERFASQLETLTHNSENFVAEGDSRLKVRHLNNDHAAFDEVMTAEPPVDYADLRHADSRIVEAHQYFTTAVTQWLGETAARRRRVKAEATRQRPADGLQLVTIELLSSENSQEIFETLNARGTPLTAADLVRNFVFQRLEAEGGDTKKAYREDWPFETKFWTKEVSVGRYFVSRSSLFLNQWLMSRPGEEVSPQSTFTRFKSYVEHQAGHKMADLLPELKEQAHSTKPGQRPRRGREAASTCRDGRLPDAGQRRRASQAASHLAARTWTRSSARRRRRIVGVSRELGRPPPASAPDGLRPRPHRRRHHQGALRCACVGARRARDRHISRG